MFLEISLAVGLYCSYHAAQASKGNLQKTCYENFGTSGRPTQYDSAIRSLEEGANVGDDDDGEKDDDDDNGDDDDDDEEKKSLKEKKGKRAKKKKKKKRKGFFVMLGNGPQHLGIKK